MKVRVFILTVCLVFSTLAASQQKRPARLGSPLQRLEQAFKKTSPAVGELLPDVMAYDAAGKKFFLRSLKGHHTVLTFGCLT